MNTDASPQAEYSKHADRPQRKRGRPVCRPRPYTHSISAVMGMRPSSFVRIHSYFVLVCAHCLSSRQSSLLRCCLLDAENAAALMRVKTRQRINVQTTGLMSSSCDISFIYFILGEWLSGGSLTWTSVLRRFTKHVIDIHRALNAI